MTGGLKPGRTPFTEASRRDAEFAQDTYAHGLPRIRAAALAWRNGIGALLAGVIGFGLIKGRSDVGDLASPYDVIVGVLLAFALFCGGSGTYFMLRAAHGRPASASKRTLFGRKKTLASLGPDHRETLISGRALLTGMVLAGLCLTFLTIAVGMTWYGPAKEDLRVRVWPTHGGLPVCGQVVSLNNGSLQLDTDHGRQTVQLATADGLKAVDSCEKPTP